MIAKLRLLRSVGQFDAVSSGAAIDLKKLTLVFAENARGKTTLAAILRSLGSGEALPIMERRRLGATTQPEVIIDCPGHTSPARFQNGTWSRTYPDVLVFDDVFVDRNVYSGMDVNSEHRQNLHDLILGQAGVSLAQRVDQLSAQIRNHNTELREKGNAIPASVRYGVAVDEFCNLQQRQDIDQAIKEAEQRLAALNNASAVQRTALFTAFALPVIDWDGIERLLHKTIADLDQQAATAVQEHIASLGQGGEDWVAKGMKISSALSGSRPGDNCPFCEQPLADSDLYSHYRNYFGAAYTQLQNDLAGAVTNLNTQLSGDALAGFERSLNATQQRRTFWAGLANIPETSIDSTEIARVWQSARDNILGALAEKRSAPLNEHTLSEAALDAVRLYREKAAALEAASNALATSNSEIRRVKEAAAGGNATTAETELKRLQATRSRFEAETAALCATYLTEKAAKTAAETAKVAAQQALDNYRASAFPSWQTAINSYLSRLGANFTLVRIESQATPGRPTCAYRLLINGHEVAVAAGTVPAGQHSFKTTLSAGDRNTLALAFFLAALDADPNKASRVVVLDDPMCSLDKHRRLQTIFEIRRLLPTVAQVVVMSHDEYFLFEVYDRVSTRNTQGISDTAALIVSRTANGSLIDLWEIESEKIGKHDKRHLLLKQFTSGNGGERLTVAQSIRPHLEHYLRAACPDHFRDGEMLRDFRNRARSARQNGAPIISEAKFTELDQLVEYSNGFHHDTNPAADAATINDAELNHFAGRALAFVSLQ